MAKFNADEKVFDPIEVTLGGKDYVIKDVTQDMFDKVKEISATENNGAIAVRKQLGVLLNEDAEMFSKVDLRRAGAALKFLTNTITSQLEGKEGNA